MSANTEKRRHSLANFKIDDPGASGTISGRNSGYVDIVTAGAESRTVDTPVRGGLELTLNGKTLAGAATIAVTNYIGTDDSLVLSTNGDCIVLKSVDVNGTLTWKQVGGTKWETATLTTVSATTVNATDVNATGKVTVPGDVYAATTGLIFSDPATVTQGTNFGTAVAIVTACGTITTLGATAAAAGEESFNVTNAALLGTEIVLISAKYNGTTGTPLVWVSDQAAGSFTISVTNLHASEVLNGTNSFNINYLIINQGQ